MKTMIRERNSRAYRRGSVAYHAVALAVAACLSPWLAIPFSAYLARAAALPGRGLRVPVVGAIEVAASLALLVTLLLVFQRAAPLPGAGTRTQAPPDGIRTFQPRRRSRRGVRGGAPEGRAQPGPAPAQPGPGSGLPYRAGG
ncbi:hypothetical protein ACFWUZ_14765 [Streptomyces sp. NPDC058646]|uniref:hypothetical protein n=1 Tax=Streptomyces sp. NPDC058646 TaxID=3346574 RepID=UPI003650B3A1